MHGGLQEVYRLQVSDVGAAVSQGMGVGLTIVAGWGVFSSFSEGGVTLDYPWQSGLVLEEEEAGRLLGKLEEPMYICSELIGNLLFACEGGLPEHSMYSCHDSPGRGDTLCYVLEAAC